MVYQIKGNNMVLSAQPSTSDSSNNNRPPSGTYPYLRHKIALYLWYRYSINPDEWIPTGDISRHFDHTRTHCYLALRTLNTHGWVATRARDTDNVSARHKLTPKGVGYAKYIMDHPEKYHLDPTEYMVDLLINDVDVSYKSL